jgi:glycosyltransferase involved in cell wall biosynthesis
VLRRSAGAIVTSSDRADWLDTRRWLPRRPVTVVPVFSNVPVAAPANGAGHGLRVGVFGFRMVYDQVDAVTVAFARLRERRPDARLVLVGAPGPDSDHADRWRAAMARGGCAEELEFSGVLAPDALSAALAGLDTVVYADPSGPTSRRGTLAAALAHGRPVVALDGPQRWDSLADAGAVVLSPPDPVALAEQLERFAADPELRRRVGERGRAFYERSMAPSVAAERVLAFLEEIA